MMDGYSCQLTYANVSLTMIAMANLSNSRAWYIFFSLHERIFFSTRRQHESAVIVFEFPHQMRKLAAMF